MKGVLKRSLTLRLSWAWVRAMCRCSSTAGYNLHLRGTLEFASIELGPLHYRGPHPAHCAAWISVGPMVAIKWGLHTRNHTLEEPHTRELVDGDS